MKNHPTDSIAKEHAKKRKKAKENLILKISEMSLDEVDIECDDELDDFLDKLSFKKLKVKLAEV